MQCSEGWGYTATKLMAQTAKAILGRRAASKWRASQIEDTTQVLAKDFCGQWDAHLPDSTIRIAPTNLDQHLRTQVEHYGFNQILHYEDHSAMMASIEMRSPFVDYRLMEFASGLPDRMKFSDGITKRIERDAFATRLPASIVDGHRKIGFATPFQSWMDTPALKRYCQELVGSRSFQGRNIWKGADIKARFDRAADYPNFPFWRFMNLERWARDYGISNL